MQSAVLSGLVEECVRNMGPEWTLEAKVSECSSFDILLLLPIRSVDHLDDLLSFLYGTTREVLTRYGHVLLPINVVLGNFDKSHIWDTVFALNGSVVSQVGIHSREQVIIEMPRVVLDHSSEGKISSMNVSEDRNKFQVTALGGTFDHIHDGHKILLTVGAFLTSQRLIVGLTDQELLVNKKYKEMLQSFEQRSANIEKFLQLLKPSLWVEIIALHDVCGPTGTVPEIESLVVSQETLSGADMVNKTRQEKQMHPLEVVVVNVLGSDGGKHDNWQGKLSSTDIRRILHEQTTHQKTSSRVHTAQ